METVLYMLGIFVLSLAFTAGFTFLIPFSITQWAKARRDYELLRAEATEIQELRVRLAETIATAAATIRIERNARS